MASVKGFELKEVERFRGKDGETLQQASLYHEISKVGFISEQQDGGLPSIQIIEEYQVKWQEAIAYFKQYFYDSLDIATGEELFYFLLTLNEWERILKQQLGKGVAMVIVLEEIDKMDGYRTGGYKVYTPKSEEELQDLIEDAESYSTEEAVWWKKISFRNVDDLNFG